MEGLRGLYAGLTPNLIGSTMGWGLYFFTYNNAKRRYQERCNTTQLSAPYHLVSGIEAGVMGTLLTNPIWVVKTRMTLQRHGTDAAKAAATSASRAAAAAPTRYTSTLGALASIAREEGLAGLYRGVGPSLLLVSHGAIQFMTYEEVKRSIRAARASALSPLQLTTVSATCAPVAGANAGARRCPQAPSAQESKLVHIDHAIAATVSKIFASTATYPSQVLRSRQQQLLDGAAQAHYRTIASTLKWIVRNEGVGGLYKGLVPNTLKVLPASIITFVVYEAVINSALKD